MRGERLVARRRPESRGARVKAARQRRRWRAGSAVGVAGVVVAATTLLLWLYLGGAASLLALPAGILLALLGLRMMRRNRRQRRAGSSGRMEIGYWEVQEGARRLLRLDGVKPVDAIFLRAVRRLAGWRLRRLGRVPAGPEGRRAAQLKANLLEAQVEAALQGHDLGAWERVDRDGRGWQARCRKCGNAVYASSSLLHSLLEERCAR